MSVFVIWWVIRCQFRVINDHIIFLTIYFTANADIFFDDTLKRVARCRSDNQHTNGSSTVLALQKWLADRNDYTSSIRSGSGYPSTDGYPLPHIVLRIDSQDAWVFQPPFNQHVVKNSFFHLGAPKCDNRLVYVLQEANYTVIDPAFAVRAIEFEFSSPALYGTKDAVVGEVTDLLLSDEFAFF